MPLTPIGGGGGGGAPTGPAGGDLGGTYPNPYALQVSDGSGNIIFDGVSRIINSSTSVVMADFSDDSKVVLFPVVLSGAAPTFNSDGSFVMNSIHSDTAGQNWFASGLYAGNFGDSAGNTIFSVSTSSVSFYSSLASIDSAGGITGTSFTGNGSNLTGYAPSLTVGTADVAANADHATNADSANDANFATTANSASYANEAGFTDSVNLPQINADTLYPYSVGPAHLDMGYGAVRNNNNSNLLYDWGFQQMWQLDGLHLSADFDVRKLIDSSDTENLCWEGGIGLFGATPTGRYSAAQDTTGFSASTGTPWLSGSYITGAVGSSAYSIGDIVTALKLLGVLDL